MFIYPLIADANDSLPDSFNSCDIVAPVEKFFTQHFKISWKINAVLTTSLPHLIIPEDGVGGKTYSSDFVILAINPSNTTSIKVSEMGAHELAHAIRWGKNPEWSKNLFYELVNEGLATRIEAEFAKKQVTKTFFLETILNRSDETKRAMFDKLKPQFNAENYNYHEIFFGNGQQRWAGYSVGNYIVDQYLHKTGKSIFDALCEPYDNFAQIVL